MATNPNGYGTSTFPNSVVDRLMKLYYNSENTFIADNIFPRKVVTDVVAAGKITVPKYTATDGNYFEGERGLKAPISQIDVGQFGTQEVELTEVSGKVDKDYREMAEFQRASNGSFNEAQSLIQKEIIDKIALKFERDASILVQDTSNYETSNVNAKTDTYWDATTGNPYADIVAMHYNIKANSNVTANTLVIPYDVWTKGVMINENVTKIIPDTQNGIVTVPWFLSLFASIGITNLYIGQAVNANEDGTSSQLWSDKVALLKVDSIDGMETWGRKYATNTRPTMTYEKKEHETLHSWAGKIQKADAIVSKRAGGLITNILTP